MKFKRFIKGFSILNIAFMLAGGWLLVFSLGDVLSLVKSAHDYDYVMQNGLKEGDHIKGEIYFSLGCFASELTTREYSDNSTSSSISNYYYIIPTGESAMAAIEIHKDQMEIMEALTDETYDYLADVTTQITGGLEFNGVVRDMAETGLLEEYFTEYLKSMDYTESEIDEMRAESDGKLLILMPRNETACYVMFGLSFVMISLSIILYVRRYKKEKAWEEKREEEWTQV